MDAALRKNMEAQRDRLLDQLTDIEEMKEELDADEYEATKKDTLDQLKEFETSLAKMVAGDMTLQSELEATRMAVRAAISESFKTPEVIRMFAKKEPAALRRRLAEIDRDVKLGKLDFSTVSSQAAEILVALKKLGEPLEPKEEVRARPHGSHPFLLLCARPAGRLSPLASCPSLCTSQNFLAQHKSTSLADFEAVADDSGDVKNFPSSSS